MIGKDEVNVKTFDEYPRREGKRYLIHAAFTKKKRRAVYKCRQYLYTEKIVSYNYLSLIGDDAEVKFVNSTQSQFSCRHFSVDPVFDKRRLDMNLFQKRLFLILVIVLLMSITGAVLAQGSGAAPMIESKAPNDPEMTNCIAGTVWYDGNHNGLLDEPSENVMDGASVTLLEIGPFQYQMGPYRLATHQFTRDGGTYEFCGLTPGTYEVRVRPSISFVNLSMPVHTLNGTTYSDIWSGEDNVQSLFMTTTGNNPVQVKLNQGGYAEINVGFVLPTVTK